ncbi:MAG TPA: efflux RND transporter periplasmic adaptor subunit [Candidatus Acidoferrum sp.]|nr:efflux RND transporter periplasmic adaptor subunit [Candidatus Acidoferrum sp.]
MTTKSKYCDPLSSNSETTSTEIPVSSNKRVARSSSPHSAQLLFASLLLLAALAGCSSKDDKPAPPPPGVTVTPVVKKDVEIQQEWVGSMLGNVDADIRPKVDGFLLKQLYAEGSYVNKGQRLFELDSRQTQASVEQAKGKLERARASLAQAQIDVKRYTPLVVQRAISQAELDKAISMERAAKAEVDADQAVLDNANLNLGWTTVTSPISGIAGISKVGVGDLMTPITVMTTISNVDPINVDFSIVEQDYMRFQREKLGRAAGRSLQLILGDGTVYPQRGRALLVNREVDSRTGTIQVRAEFPNPGNVLRPGQYARIRAVTEVRKGALLIPQRAVAELQGVYQVGVVGADNKVTVKAVNLGPQVADAWIVESGLQAGDNVIVDGLQRLRNGMTVAPAPFKDTQANALIGEK